MYRSLYEAWKREIENPKLQSLPLDFYGVVADYLQRLREEGRMLDKKTIKAVLLKRELLNVRRMVNEIIMARYRKVVKILATGEKIPSGTLTAEEEKIYSVAPISDTVQSFAKNVLRGFLLKVDVKVKHRRTVLRFLADVPAIIGSDMKPYGPFKAEDVASLPVENANVLIKQRLAEKVELS
jgi:DNA replication factor GINS